MARTKKSVLIEDTEAAYKLATGLVTKKQAQAMSEEDNAVWTEIASAFDEVLEFGLDFGQNLVTKAYIKVVVRLYLAVQKADKVSKFALNIAFLPLFKHVPEEIKNPVVSKKEDEGK